MISLILFSIALLILLPLAVAFVEGHKRQLNPADDGYWTLARALLGGCHLRWSPDPTPIVWFDIGDGQGDDIVLRQIREAALKETNPILREKLWDEYRKIKGI